MANTKQGIYYQDNYSSVADVPSDMKKMAESIDTELETDRGRLSTTENNIQSLQSGNTTNKQDISNIKTEQTTQNANIETLTQKLNEKDNQIAELEDKVSDLNNNQIYGKASGEYVHLSDSAKMNCEITVLGNSRQETGDVTDGEGNVIGTMPSIDYPSEIETVGDNVNLLQNFATSQTIDGVTFTVNKDGTVIANGTAPTSKNVTFVINNKQLSLPAGEYALSGCPSTYVKKRICRIDIWKSDWSNLCSEMGDGGRMTLSEDIENLIVGITIFKGETVNNLVFEPKIEKGTVATAYSLYGIGSENVKVYNRNLLNTPYNSENKLTDTATSDGYYITTGFKAYLIAGKTYRFKCESNLKFGFASDGGEGLCYLMLNRQSNTFFQLLSNDRTITVKESGWYYLRYDIYKANKTASFWNFQIEEGTNATDYIAHEEQNYTIDIQEEMLEGDYFDLENGKEVHNWQKIESYNGEEITTEYKSTTGELSTGATVYYKLSEPSKLDLTENQKAQLQALQKAKTYKNITNITTDTIAVLDVDYKRDLETYQKQQDDRITAIEQLLSTTATSAMLLDNVQSDLESEVK